MTVRLVKPVITRSKWSFLQSTMLLKVITNKYW